MIREQTLKLKRNDQKATNYISKQNQFKIHMGGPQKSIKMTS